MERAYRRAHQSGDTQLRQLLGAAIASVRDRAPDGNARVMDVVNHCGGSVPSGGDVMIKEPSASPRASEQVPARPSRPISPTEADEHLKGVLAREKATDAKCTKKQYGTGWVTVCE